MIQYFAYGSNMHSARMNERKIEASERVQANLCGFRPEFNKLAKRNPKEGYANIIRDEKGLVEGILYDIPDSCIKILDRFEGYPDDYERIRVLVQKVDGKRVEAITYIAQPDKIRDGLKPTKAYLAHLLAAQKFLSTSYYEALLTRETLD
jgi:gamma-glutamylcyclotransferase